MAVYTDVSFEELEKLLQHYDIGEPLSFIPSSSVIGSLPGPGAPGAGVRGRVLMCWCLLRLGVD